MLRGLFLMKTLLPGLRFFLHKSTFLMTVYFSSRINITVREKWVSGHKRHIEQFEVIFTVLPKRLPVFLGTPDFQINSVRFPM